MRTAGSILRTMRERQGRSLDELAAITRVSRAMLQALEEGRHDALPAPAYVKGFVRAYCRELGVDPTEIVKLYEAEVHARQPDSRPGAVAPVLVLSGGTAVSPRRPRAVGRATYALVLAVAALTFLAAVMTASLGDAPHKGAPPPETAIQTSDAAVQTLRSVVTDVRR